MSVETGPATSGHGDLLDRLLAEFLDELASGREVDVDSVCARHAGCSEVVREAWRLAQDIAIDRPPQQIVIPGFIIERKLGQGGMGVVYLARQTSLNRSIALKVLPSLAAGSESSRRRFLAEARALAAVRHDHVVAIHDVIEGDGVLAYTMDWIDGRSLKELLPLLHARIEASATLARPRELGGRTLLQFVVQTGLDIGAALQAVHDLGLVHRDVKPGNILVRRDGHVFLADFGLVRDPTSSLTVSGNFVGTWAYAAPEQLRGDTVDARADVYSLGVSLYEALSGVLPFAGRSPTELLAAVEADQAVPLRKRVPQAPRDLETILAHAFERRPEARYPTAREFAEDLGRLVRLEPIRARPVGLVERLVRWSLRRRSVVLAATIGGLAIALLAVAIVWYGAAAAARSVRAREEAGEARTELLGFLDYDVQEDGRLDAQPARLRRALQHYATAVGLDETQPRIKLEHDLLAAVLALGAPLSQFEGAVALVAQLPQSCDVLRAARTREAFQADPAHLSDSDRWGLGFVGCLTQRTPVARAAWEDLDPVLRPEPFVDAMLGILYQEAGQSALACARLLRANGAFPGIASLSLRLGEAALAIGDARLAARSLNAADGPLTAWMTARRALLQADLQADLLKRNRGNVGAAFAAYERCASLKTAPQATREASWLRMVELKLERGGIVAAAARCEDFPTASPVGWLARSRVAIACRDPRMYAGAARWVVQQGFGGGQSPGTIRDMLEVLRLGGLFRLCRKGLLVTGLESRGAGDPLFEPEITFPRPFSAPGVEALLQRLIWSLTGDAEAVAVALLTVGGLVYHLPENVVMSEIVIRSTAAPIRSLFDRSMQFRAIALAALGLVEAQAVAQAPLFEWTGPQSFANFGSAMASVGDIDGDGYADLLFGAPGGSGGTWNGGAFLHSGRTGALLHSFNSGLREYLGHTVAPAGDLNGDGTPDVLIGSNMPDNRGRVEAWSYSRVAGTWSILWSTLGSAANDFRLFAHSLGDVNGDGVPDVLIGGNGIANNFGRIDLVNGTNAAVIRSWAGTQSLSGFGAIIAPMPDLNGDGKPDFLAGAPTYDGPNGTDSGALFLYSSATVSAPTWIWLGQSAGEVFGRAMRGPDLDGDGIDDVLVQASMYVSGGPGRALAYSSATRREIARWDGTVPGSRYGCICRAGDVDGDGVEDLAIAAPFTSNLGITHAGSLQIFSGRDLHRPITAVIYGDQAEDELGPSELGAQSITATDLNRDGYDDFLVFEQQAPQSSTSNPLHGRVRVFRGAPFGATVIGAASTCCVGLPIQAMSVNSEPTPGNQSFAFTCKGLPHGSVAIPAVAFQSANVPFGCMTFLVDPSSWTLVGLNFPDAKGVVTVRIPVPATYALHSAFGQVFVYDPASTCNPGGLSSSNALRF